MFISYNHMVCLVHFYFVSQAVDWSFLDVWLFAYLVGPSVSCLVDWLLGLLSWLLYLGD